MFKGNPNKDTRLCGAISNQTAVFLVSIAAILTNGTIYVLSLYPRWIEYNFELLVPSESTFMSPRIAGVVVSALGILAAMILLVGNRCELRAANVVFLICTGVVIFYSYFAAFIILFRVLLLSQEKGDLHRQKHFIEAGVYAATTVLNFFYCFVVARSTK